LLGSLAGDVSHFFFAFDNLLEKECILVTQLSAGARLGFANAENAVEHSDAFGDKAVDLAQEAGQSIAP
jgi:hypothetical protein